MEAYLEMYYSLLNLKVMSLALAIIHWQPMKS